MALGTKIGYVIDNENYDNKAWGGRTHYCVTPEKWQLFLSLSGSDKKRVSSTMSNRYLTVGLRDPRSRTENDTPSRDI